MSTLPSAGPTCLCQLCHIPGVAPSVCYGWNRQQQLAASEPAQYAAMRQAGGATARGAFVPRCAPKATGSDTDASAACKPCTTDSEPSVRAAPNRLLGQLTPTARSQVWAGGIMCLPRQGDGWLYLATYPDRCSRKVVGWDVGESIPEDLVSEAVRRALAVRQPASGLVVHSDQGSQYAATRFKALLVRHRAVQSMSRRGNCYDNAPAESFWSRLKIELFDGAGFPGLAEVRLEISHHIAYYNAEIGHSAPAYRPTTSKSKFKSHPNRVQHNRNTLA